MLIRLRHRGVRLLRGLTGEQAIGKGSVRAIRWVFLGTQRMWSLFDI